MLLTLFFLLMVPNFKNEPVPKDVTVFAKEIVQSFRKKNFNQYNKLCTKPEDFTNEILPAIKKDTLHFLPDGMIQQAIEFDKTNNDSVRNVIFQRYLFQGEKLGINWAEIQYEDVEFEKKIGSKLAENLLNCHIRFSHKGQSYLLFGLIGVRLKRGYCLRYIVHVEKNGMNN